MEIKNTKHAPTITVSQKKSFFFGFGFCCAAIMPLLSAQTQKLYAGTAPLLPEAWG